MHPSFLRPAATGGALLFLAAFLLAAPVVAQPAAGPLLQEMLTLAEQALDDARAAANAETVAEVKRHADAVFAAVWGVPSGLVEARGAAAVPGWKERWQTTYSNFDPAFAARYGNAPPTAGPEALGIVGRGRYVRAQLDVLDEVHAGHVVAALNNVIGHMRMDDGVTKAERQPRVDLTRYWDAPSDFWNTTADTGWLFEVYSQALNILKTDYGADADLARQHAAAMASLLEKALDGVDADGDGSIAPAMMEGGLRTAIAHARLGGYLIP